MGVTDVEGLVCVTNEAHLEGNFKLADSEATPCDETSGNAVAKGIVQEQEVHDYTPIMIATLASFALICCLLLSFSCSDIPSACGFTPSMVFGSLSLLSQKSSQENSSTRTWLTARPTTSSSGRCLPTTSRCPASTESASTIATCLPPR